MVDGSRSGWRMKPWRERILVCAYVNAGFAVIDVHSACLGERKVGDQVNLERAMGAHVRFGGHFVQVRGN